MDDVEPDRESPTDDAGEFDGRTYKGLELSLFQLQAIEAIRAGANVLVSAPTGAGKTLVAEYAIEDAVRRGRRCIYTAPIKALSNQKYRDFRDDPDIDVGLMTGDVTIHPHAQVLIMTTEILRNSIFESPRNLDDVEYVIFDEVHYMDDPERGTVWEESLIFAPEEIRFICLSATISNLDELGSWVREIRRHELEIVRSEKRPVPLHQQFFLPGLARFDASKLEWARSRATPPPAPSRSRGGKGRRGGRGGGRDDRMRLLEDRRREEAKAFSGLLDEFVDEGLTPLLCFCFSRKDCERLSRANRKRDLLDGEERERMRRMQEELVEAYQLDEGELQGEVFQLARRGIGYHHAGMLPIHKEVVERLFTSGLLRLLFTTETFALGINMPARTVVFFGLKKFDGVTFDYMRTRDFMQMAGRAGRQGIDREGLVVSRLEHRDLEDAPLERLVSGKPEPVQSRFRLAYSSILHLIEHLGRERLFEAWEKSFNQFQHRGRSRKAREKNRAEQRRLLHAHLDLLTTLGYLEEDRLTGKGHVACGLYGYELQIVELLWHGALEDLPPEALAMVFVALIYEERRRGVQSYVSPKLFGGVRRHVSQVVAALARQEAEAGVPTPMKVPDWGLTQAAVAWARGATFDELEEQVDVPGGDIVRTFRMAVQLARQLERAIDPAWDLSDRLRDVLEALNRDEVDARRQLELG